jgi:hypothetical protein
MHNMLQSYACGKGVKGEKNVEIGEKNTNASVNSTQ